MYDIEALRIENTYLGQMIKDKKVQEKNLIKSIDDKRQEATDLETKYNNLVKENERYEQSMIENLNTKLKNIETERQKELDGVIDDINLKTTIKENLNSEVLTLTGQLSDLKSLYDKKYTEYVKISEDCQNKEQEMKAEKQKITDGMLFNSKKIKEIDDKLENLVKLEKEHDERMKIIKMASEALSIKMEEEEIKYDILIKQTTENESKEKELKALETQLNDNKIYIDRKLQEIKDMERKTITERQAFEEERADFYILLKKHQIGQKLTQQA